MACILSIIGKKGSGKSQVLETLISLLSKRGIRMGVLKHLARDDFEIDEPGKDTYRYRAEGAQKVVLAGRKRLAVFSNLDEEVSFEDLLSYFIGFDLVFLEGYFQDEIPKIEVHKKELGDLLLGERVGNIFAICSDGRGRPDIPSFAFEQLDELAGLIEDRFLRKEAGVS